MERNYSDAIAALNTLQSNAATIAAIRQSGRSTNKFAIPEMIDWSRRTGYEPSAFNALNPIHIAGTKGKGSTSAFLSSILTHSLPPTAKVGLYTSPHLRYVRERIQINNAPLSEALFAHYFFATWDRLEASAAARGEPTNPCAKPVYFRYLTLMALHVFASEGVDATVVECGIGGEYDSTNILERPRVVGITSLGIDHTAVLGGTVEEIAWHKAGIMKPGAVAFTVGQPEGAMRVLRERAAEKGVELRVVRDTVVEGCELGLAGEFQRGNASLAVEIAREFLREIRIGKVGGEGNTENGLPEEFKRGLREVKWGGRCETRIEGGVGWYLDGGHTLESVEVAGRWFAGCVLDAKRSSTGEGKRSPPRVLIFNQQTRAGMPLLKKLHGLLVDRLSEEANAAHPFSHVIFCSNITFSTGYRPDLMSINADSKDVEGLNVQKELASVWRQIDGEGCQVEVARTIEDAIIGIVGKIAASWAGEGASGLEKEGKGRVMVLVTGSLHLVGGALEVLDAAVKAAEVGKK